MHQYKWDASDYAKSSSQQQQWARELIRKLALKGDERLLDIGCGDGKVTAEIAACLPRGSAVGIDSSKDMVALAQGTFPAELFPNLGFERQDASNLSFHDEFDVVFSNAALHWVLDHRPVLHGIYNSLRRGGKTLLQMGGQGNAADVITALDKLVASDEWHDYFVGFGLPYGFYSPDEYSEWLCAAGLRAIRIELIPKDMTHYGREGLEGWFRTTWLPYTQRVPEDKRTAFTDQLVNAYLKDHSPDDQGVVHVKMIRLEVEAVKDC